MTGDTRACRGLEARLDRLMARQITLAHFALGAFLLAVGTAFAQGRLGAGDAGEQVERAVLDTGAAEAPERREATGDGSDAKADER